MAEIEITTDESGIQVVNGSMRIEGNLGVSTQISTNELKVLGEDHLPIISTAGNTISFKKAVEFTKPVHFNNGKTIIGTETTYNSAYIGSPTLQAGNRLVVGDSLFKITADLREIIADTFKMTLARLEADKVVSKKEISDIIEAK